MKSEWNISRELTDLHGKFEVVSNDVLLLKDKIDEEARKLSTKVDEYQKSGLEKVESLFDRKFLAAAGGELGAALLCTGPSCSSGIILVKRGGRGRTSTFFGWADGTQ
jgi:hypothetical protein